MTHFESVTAGPRWENTQTLLRQTRRCRKQVKKCRRQRQMKNGATEQREGHSSSSEDSSSSGSSSSSSSEAAPPETSKEDEELASGKACIVAPRGRLLHLLRPASRALSGRIYTPLCKSLAFMVGLAVAAGGPAFCRDAFASRLAARPSMQTPRVWVVQPMALMSWAQSRQSVAPPPLPALQGSTEPPTDAQ